MHYWCFDICLFVLLFLHVGISSASFMKICNIDVPSACWWSVSVSWPFFLMITLPRYLRTCCLLLPQLVSMVLYRTCHIGMCCTPFMSYTCTATSNLTIPVIVALSVCATWCSYTTGSFTHTLSKRKDRLEIPHSHHHPPSSGTVSLWVMYIEYQLGDLCWQRSREIPQLQPTPELH